MIGDDTSLPPLHKTPELWDKVQRDIDQREMQLYVAAGVAGGIGIGAIIIKALREGAQTEEEKKAAKKLPFYIGAVGGTLAVFHLLDLDKRWLTPAGLEEMIKEKM